MVAQMGFPVNQIIRKYPIFALNKQKTGLRRITEKKIGETPSALPEFPLPETILAFGKKCS